MILGHKEREGGVEKIPDRVKSITKEKVEKERFACGLSLPYSINAWKQTLYDPFERS